MIPLPIIVRTANGLHLAAEKGDTAQIGKPITEAAGAEALGGIDALVKTPTDLAAWQRTLNSLTENVTREISNFASTWTLIQLALIGVAFLASRFPSKAINASGYCFTIGACIFSFSLYTLALTGR